MLKWVYDSEGDMHYHIDREQLRSILSNFFEIVSESFLRMWAGVVLFSFFFLHDTERNLREVKDKT